MASRGRRDEPGDRDARRGGAGVRARAGSLSRSRTASQQAVRAVRGGRAARRRGAAGDAPAAAAAAGAGARRRGARAGLRRGAVAALALARRGRLHAPDVRLPRRLQDAQRRRRGARAARPPRLSGAPGSNARAGGELPTSRLQRALHPDGYFRGYEKVLVWAHWVWFATPHATLAYLALCDPQALPARGGPDLRGLRPRRDLLLGGPHRAAVVRRRSAGGPARSRCGG